MPDLPTDAVRKAVGMDISVDHEASAHDVAGSPHEQMRGIMARHLCGWISGHSAPVDHFLADADLILAEAYDNGLRLHLAKRNGAYSSSDGYVGFEPARE